MKDGLVVERGRGEDIFNNPREPYTKALLSASLNLKPMHDVVKQ
jgi:ABC-type oligopeptide transport system ATPase subunit